MKNPMSAFAWIPVLLVLSLLGVGTWIYKPKSLHGETKRAEASASATANLEKATTAQGASAAASAVKIGEANSAAPESPSKAFIAQEVPVMLAKLPPPDSQALLEAERRRSAVMEGRVVEARQLYEGEATRSAALQKERDAALAARREADTALLEAAAVARAADQRSAIFIVVAVLAGALWLYARFMGVTPAALGRIAAEIRSGTNPITALDIHTPPWLHSMVQKAAQAHVAGVAAKAATAKMATDQAAG